jgi:alpha,alpha-trehalase
MQKIYPDSKTFVDKKLLRSEEEILEAYRKLKIQNNETLNNDVLAQFIEENFVDDPLAEWVPPDFVDKPSIVNFVHDNKYRY